MPALIPLPAMARRLGVTNKWLRGEADAQRVPHLRAGERLLFHADDVERVLVERCRQTVTEGDADAE